MAHLVEDRRGEFWFLAHGNGAAAQGARIGRVILGKAERQTSRRGRPGLSSARAGSQSWRNFAETGYRAARGCHLAPTSRCVQGAVPQAAWLHGSQTVPCASFPLEKYPSLQVLPQRSFPNAKFS